MPEYDELNSDDELIVAATLCQHVGCKLDIVAACTKQECQCLLCYEHFLDQGFPTFSAQRPPSVMTAFSMPPSPFLVPKYQRFYQFLMDV